MVTGGNGVGSGCGDWRDLAGDGASINDSESMAGLSRRSGACQP